ncbi:hypothetical protein ACQRUO_39625, partial [Kitasatospora sp. LaBMicrA B282]
PAAPIASTEPAVAGHPLAAAAPAPPGRIPQQRRVTGPGDGPPSPSAPPVPSPPPGPGRPSSGGRPGAGSPRPPGPARSRLAHLVGFTRRVHPHARRTTSTTMIGA